MDKPFNKYYKPPQLSFNYLHQKAVFIANIEVFTIYNNKKHM